MRSRRLDLPTPRSRARILGSGLDTLAFTYQTTTPLIATVTNTSPTLAPAPTKPLFTDDWLHKYNPHPNA